MFQASRANVTKNKEIAEALTSIFREIDGDCSDDALIKIIVKFAPSNPALFRDLAEEVKLKMRSLRAKDDSKKSTQESDLTI